MTNSINTENGVINTLKTECLIDLHELLSKNTHLLEKMDPVEPRGIKNIGMLESAIGRQTTGFGDFYKYSNCFSNCATLTYGIIKNHSFHNGNKRAGLLCLIKHLYVNGYVLSPKLNSNELYEFLVSIADSKVEQFSLKYKKKYNFIRPKKERKSKEKWDSDTVVSYMAFWIKRNSKPKQTTLKGEIKISELKKLLNSKNIKLEQKGDKLEIYKEKEKSVLGFTYSLKKVNKRRYNLKGNLVSVNLVTLGKIRREFQLTKADGIDHTFFYTEEALLDSEIKTYKELIYRLSKT
ncbi:type II toxin-antitoxin system death-on-curing family toxin [Pseudofulvibacter geojedonensis]|uniref:Type II toxin-antitoxin system death-on-curing family toxin n=1 Tax=Pseudofulvibacter geojedonensis TaxID=1123758 RepID=A0ABW3I328_9FLAO